MRTVIRVQHNKRNLHHNYDDDYHEFSNSVFIDGDDIDKRMFLEIANKFSKSDWNEREEIYNKVCGGKN